MRSDVQDTGFVTSNMDSFLWLDHWCSYRCGGGCGRVWGEVWGRVGGMHVECVYMKYICVCMYEVSRYYAYFLHVRVCKKYIHTILYTCVCALYCIYVRCINK